MHAMSEVLKLCEACNKKPADPEYTGVHDGDGNPYSFCASCGESILPDLMDSHTCKENDDGYCDHCDRPMGWKLAQLTGDDGYWERVNARSERAYSAAGIPHYREGE